MRSEAARGLPTAHAGRRRFEARKWGTAVVVSVLLHGSPLILAGLYWSSRPQIVMPSESVFEVELVRLQAPPKPPSEQPHGPTQVKAEARKSQPQPPIQPRIQTAVSTAVETLTAAPPKPKIDTPSEAPPAPDTTAPTSRPAPPALVAAASVQTWEGRVLAHLERRKRYPTEARSRRLQGVTYIRVTMDRQGRVLSAVMERTSGHAVLDREALALMTRAQPLPAPPAEIVGDRVVLSVPVDFFTRG